MRIQELLEQTIAPQPPGQGQPTQPTEGPPATSNTPVLAQPPVDGSEPNNTADSNVKPLTVPPAANNSIDQKSLDSLRSQISSLQNMMAKQMQQQQQQSVRPPQS
jgi:hypothetical protein